MSNSGIHTYSAPADELVIFSVDEGAYLAPLYSYRPTRLIGKYKGKLEHSYMLPVKKFIKLFDSQIGLVLFKNQESVLKLGLPKARGWRDAELLYLHDVSEAPVNLGVFKECTKQEANSWGDYTYDPARNLYWHCVKNPPTSPGMADLEAGIQACNSLAVLCAQAQAEGYTIDTKEDIWPQVFDIIKNAWDSAEEYNKGYADGIEWARQQMLRSTQEGDHSV